MARELSDLARARSRQLADEYPWIWLYDVSVPTDPPTRFRLTNFDQPLEHGLGSDDEPLVYSPCPITHGDIAESGEGDLPKLQLQVANDSQFLRSVLEEHDGLIGQRIVVRLVHILEIGDTAAAQRWDGEIVGVKVTHERVAWEVSALSIQQAAFPTQRYMRSHCRFRYGGPRCGYDLTNATLAAAHPDCSKSLQACTDRGDTEEAVLGIAGRKHPQRFGGWPGIPRFSQR